jgi:hypothetical protein
MANGEAKLCVNCSCKFGLKHFLIMIIWVPFGTGFRDWFVHDLWGVTKVSMFIDFHPFMFYLNKLIEMWVSFVLVHLSKASDVPWDS